MTLFTWIWVIASCFLLGLWAIPFNFIITPIVLVLLFGGNK